MSFAIVCPICGPRDQSEFRFGNAESGPAPGHDGLTLETYVDAVLMRETKAGHQEEWWCHSHGCGTWFTLWRNTLTGRQTDEKGRQL